MTLKPPTDLDTFTGLDARVDALEVGTVTAVNITGAPYSADTTGATDATSAIAAAVTAAAILGKDVWAPAGTYLLSTATRISIPHKVNLRGAGPWSTIFNVTHADGGIDFGTSGSTLSGLGNRGGQSGGFAVYGGTSTVSRTATVPFAIHDCVQRSFTDIEVRYGNGPGVKVRQAQNLSFENVNAESNVGAGLLLDEGTGGHTFERCEYTSNDGGNLQVRNTSATGPYSAGPTDITFNGCIFERLATTRTETSNLIFESGDQIRFEACNLSWAAAALGVGDGTNVLVDATRSTSTVGHLKFHDLYSFGTGLALSCDVFQVKSFCRISISGSPRFQNPGTKDPGRGGAGIVGGAEFAMVTTTSPIVDVSGYKFSTYNTVYYDLTAGAANANGQKYIRRRFSEPVETSEYMVLKERTANPQAANADEMRLFAIDNGSGKTRLSVYTPAGDIVPIVSSGGEITASASAAGVQTLFPNPNGVYVISGTNTITGFTLTGSLGKPIILRFTSTATVQAGANVKLAGGVNFVATADDVLVIYGDGTSVWELCRSVNA